MPQSLKKVFSEGIDGKLQIDVRVLPSGIYLVAVEQAYTGSKAFRLLVVQ